MADEGAPETTSHNFSQMGGSSPEAVGAQLDAIQSRAGAAASAEAERGEGDHSQDFGLAGLSTDARLARLDDIMAQAEIAANAERDLEAEGHGVLEAEDLEEGDDEDEFLDDEDEELTDEEPAAEPAQRREGEQPEPRRMTRREAERIAGELQQHRHALQARAAADQRILHHLQEQSGYTKEVDGRFKYEVLREKVLSGSATRAERDECARMVSWHEFAGPIFQAAEDQVGAAFSDGYRRSIESVIAAEKLEPAAAQRLWKSPDPIREAVLLGRELERKAAKAKPVARAAPPPARSPQQHRPATSAAHIPPRLPGEAGWMTPILDRLDREMSVAAEKANAQRDREAAELEAERRRRVRSR